jgi:exodeoxyribonuclease VII small subunit
MPKEMTLKQAMDELENITKEFEQGDLDIEAGIKKFERGIEVSSVCKKKLAEIENKIIEVKAKYAEV